MTCSLPILTLKKLSLWSALLVFVCVGCVDLTPPWQQGRDASLASQGGSTEPGPGDTGGAFGGSGGVGGATGLGGADGQGDVARSIDGALVVLDAAIEGGAAVDVQVEDKTDAPAGSDSDDTLDVAIGGGGAGGAGSDAWRDGGTGGRAGSGGAGGTGGKGGAKTGGASGSGGSTAKGSGGAGSGGALGGDASVSACSGYTGGAGGVDGGLSAGLVAYYPCEEASGTSLPDSSGNGKDGVLGNTPSGTGGTPGYRFDTGHVGKALILNSASKGYVSVPAGILSGACEATVATWVYVNTSADWQRIWDFGKDETVYMFLTPSNNFNKKLRFAISIGGNGTDEQMIDGQATLPTGVWTHVAVVLGPAGGLLYVDGVAVGTNAGMTLRPADLGAMPASYIGRSHFAGDPYFDGKIDDFRVYNRALSSEEILSLYGGL